MLKFIIIGILIILFGVFLYWAYLPDYKRNPKEFWRTIIGMPIGLLLGSIGFTDANERIKKWVTDNNRTEKDDL
jgi:H+/Cl- antiporter ClcA